MIERRFGIKSTPTKDTDGSTITQNDLQLPLTPLEFGCTYDMTPHDAELKVFRLIDLGRGIQSFLADVAEFLFDTFTSTVVPKGANRSPIRCIRTSRSRVGS